MAENMSKAGSPNRPAPTPAGQPASNGSHWGTWVLIFVVIALGIGAFLLFGEKKTKQPFTPPVSITVTNVVKGDIEVAVNSIANVQPIYTATISPRVDGQVISVNYTEGQMVASNDLLAVIDPGPYQAALTVAEGQLQRDKALLEGARVDLERYKKALTAIPKMTYDDQVALVHQDEGIVKLDEGQVESAKVQLNYAYVRAPFAGRVGLRLIDPGNVVHSANTNGMVVLVQLQPITVYFNLAEDYLPQVQEQLRLRQQTETADPPEIDPSSPEMRQQAQSVHPMTVEAWDRANENKIAAGSFLSLDDVIDTATGTVRIKAIFDNTNLALFPNQFVNARLIIKTLHNLSLIPTYAIQQAPEGAFVYVVTNTTVTTNGMTTNFQTVTMRTVVPGTVDGNTTAITQGLQAGEVIALDNFNKLGEGVKVVPRQTEDEPAQGGGAKHKGGSHGKKQGDEAKKQGDEAKESP